MAHEQETISLQYGNDDVTFVSPFASSHESISSGVDPNHCNSQGFGVSQCFGVSAHSGVSQSFGISQGFGSGVSQCFGNSQGFGSGTTKESGFGSGTTKESLQPAFGHLQGFQTPRCALNSFGLVANNPKKVDLKLEDIPEEYLSLGSLIRTVCFETYIAELNRWTREKDLRCCTQPFRLDNNVLLSPFMFDTFHVFKPFFSGWEKVKSTGFGVPDEFQLGTDVFRMTFQEKLYEKYPSTFCKLLQHVSYFDKTPQVESAHCVSNSYSKHACIMFNIVWFLDYSIVGRSLRSIQCLLHTFPMTNDEMVNLSRGKLVPIHRTPLANLKTQYIVYTDAPHTPWLKDYIETVGPAFLQYFEERRGQAGDNVEEFTIQHLDTLRYVFQTWKEQ